MNIATKYISAELRQALRAVSNATDTQVYLSGGVIRDWALGVASVDLDFTVSTRGVDFGKRLATDLQATFVLLSEAEGICRVVWNGLDLDISTFRKNTNRIEDDLCQRDFTINALAIEITADEAWSSGVSAIIDPLGGMDDLKNGIIKCCNDECLNDDPLRMLRTFRLMAQLGFDIDPHTTQLITKFKQGLDRVAGERIWSELKKTIQHKKSWKSFKAMDSCGLLAQVLPELETGRGVTQPSSHHLDVYDHCLETVKQIESIIDSPGQWFSDTEELMQAYCDKQENVLMLKIAALLHDIGKPPARGIKDTGQITFYNHDGHGELLVGNIAKRLRWSSAELNFISRLVKLHMWPFHLVNARKKNGITPRACLKIAKASGDDLAGLFLLAMADSLAGQGEGKPAGMEKEISLLFSEVYRTFLLRVKPVLGALPVNGHDLIEYLQLEPGPVFSEIFSELEKEMVLTGIMDKKQALEWVKCFCEKN
nr:HD domain-containing protein [Desulfobulbaceae bacterium]